MGLHFAKCTLCNCDVGWDDKAVPAVCNECEIAILRQALEWCSEYVFAVTFDCGDFQDEMVRLGLLKSVPASEQQKAEYDVDDMPMRRTRLLWRAIDWVWK